MERINRTQGRFFVQAPRKAGQEKKDKAQINDIRNEQGDIITEMARNKKVREYYEEAYCTAFLKLTTFQENVT